MERRIEEFECAEAVLLVQTFNGIRQKLMARELVADAAQIEKSKKSAKTAGAPPVFLVWSNTQITDMIREWESPHHLVEWKVGASE